MVQSAVEAGVEESGSEGLENLIQQMLESARTLESAAHAMAVLGGVELPPSPLEVRLSTMEERLMLIMTKIEHSMIVPKPNFNGSSRPSRGPGRWFNKKTGNYELPKPISAPSWSGNFTTDLAKLIEGSLGTPFNP